MKRRDLLTGAATLSIGGLAGCLEAVDPRRTEVELRHFGIVNWTETAVPMDVRVERAGEIVHENQYELEPKQGRTLGGIEIECPWGDTPGDYTVFARESNGGVEIGLSYGRKFRRRWRVS